MRFYGFDNRYGAGTTFNGNYEGELHVFESGKARDRWVRDDRANRSKLKVDHEVVRQYKGKSNTAGESGRAAFKHFKDGTVRYSPHVKHFDRYDPDALSAESMERLREQLDAERYV